MAKKMDNIFPVIIDVETAGIDILEEIKALFKEEFYVIEAEIINDAEEWKVLLGPNFPDRNHLAKRLAETEVIMLCLLPRSTQGHHQKFEEVITIISGFSGIHCAQTVDQWEHVFLRLESIPKFSGIFNHD